MNKRQQKKYIRRIKKFLSVSLRIACVSIVIWQFADAMKNDSLEDASVNAGNKIPVSTPHENYDTINVVNKESEESIGVEQTIYNQNKSTLVLVNWNHPFNNEDVQLVPICKGRLEVASAMYDDLKRMLKAASNEGFNYWIASGYRNWEKQQQLVNEDVGKYKRSGMTEGEALSKTMQETAMPGFSEHETGLALDILCAENNKMDITQEKYAGNAWLQQHCSEYGFILRYPRGKEDITHISYEPWHFRYVGKDAAAYITQNNITLEEFYERINTDTR